MSFADQAPQKTALQSDTFQNFGVPLVIFGGLIYCLWSYSQYLWRIADASTKSAAPSLQVAVGLTEPARAPGAPADSRVVEGFATVEAASTPLVEEEDASDVISISPPKPSKRPKRKVILEWKMRGVIYDLITLQPVPGVQMTFIDVKTNARAEIRSDAQGRYRTLLPSLAGRGYLVTLSKEGYVKSYLDPGTEGVAEMPLARRREIGKELSSAITAPASLQPYSDTPLLTDFHIAPK